VTTRRWTSFAIAKPLAKAAFRVLHAEDIGVGIARAIRAAVSGRPGGVYLDLPAKLFAQSIDATAGKNSLIKVVDPAPRQIPAPEAVQARARSVEGREKAADHPRQGCCLRAGGCRDSRAGREDRDPVPADVDGEGPGWRTRTSNARRPRARSCCPPPM
jgi:hypothetical protein